MAGEIPVITESEAESLAGPPAGDYLNSCPRLLLGYLRCPLGHNSKILSSAVLGLLQSSLLILFASLPNLLSFLKRQPPWQAGGGVGRGGGGREWELGGCVYP